MSVVPLLYNVSQFVGQELRSRGGGRPVVPTREDDIGAVGERLDVDRTGRSCASGPVCTRTSPSSSPKCGSKNDLTAGDSVSPPRIVDSIRPAVSLPRAGPSLAAVRPRLAAFEALSADS